MLAEMFDEALTEAGAPAGVFNLVQGAADVAKSLVAHDGIDGILFTGSWPVGRRIMEANLDRPGRIVALEMGGQQPRGRDARRRPVPGGGRGRPVRPSTPPGSDAPAPGG
jgi:succinylglutamic semialdehyde dehydrogenase